MYEINGTKIKVVFSSEMKGVAYFHRKDQLWADREATLCQLFQVRDGKPDEQIASGEVIRFHQDPQNAKIGRKKAFALAVDGLPETFRIPLLKVFFERPRVNKTSQKTA